MENKFSNMVVYAETNLKTFEQEPLNEVDCLIFSWLVYLNIHEETAVSFSPKGLPFKELLKAEYFDEMFDKTWSPMETVELLAACAASPRFRDLRLRYYRNELLADINLQFAAIVVSISDDMHVAAFRGTDWSITGWKEDALLALNAPIPAQKLAAIYLNDIGRECCGAVTVVGHSKGGNLAVYASAHCDREIQGRIQTVYSYDGPGLFKKDLNYEGYLRIKDRIRKFVPQSSYFGMLFESETAEKVIFSSEKGIMQHNPISWKVEGCSLSAEEKRNRVSSFFNERINSWLNTLTEDERRMLVQAIFDVLKDLDADSIDDFMNNPTEYIPDALRSISKMDMERRKYIRHIIRLLITGDESKCVKPSSPENPDFYAEDEKLEEEFQFFISRRKLDAQS